MESVEASGPKSDSLHGSYTVKPGDSLMSLAARVGNVTPAQLARFNRLGMLGAGHPPLFPGQRLYIPNKEEISAQNVRLRHLPGAATRVHSLSESISDRGGTRDNSQQSFGICSVPSTKDGVMERLFVKVKAKRVLLPSESEIDGVLIFTPDAVCFDAVATASALNRAIAAKTYSLQHPLSVASYDSDSGGEVVSPLAHSPPSEHALKGVEPVHDVLALSVCIPIAAVVSLNTHGDMNNLLSGCRSKTSTRAALPKDLSISTEIEIKLPEKLPERSEAPSFSRHFDEVQKVCQSTLIESEQDPLPEEVYISIGVDTGRICSADSTTLCEAATSSLHVFRIPLDKLADIHDILVSATNSVVSQPASSDLDNRRKPLPNISSDQKSSSVSIIESALEEMEKNILELTLVGGTSCILTEAMLRDLSKGLPANRAGTALRLIFSTAKDGFSLNTLYRKTKCVQDVNLLLILDQQGVAFGALLSEKMHCSQSFYGTGESCVFHWRDGFKCYNWTKKNYFFMQGSHDSFLIGAKSGHSAIWFDGDLKYGRSEATDTFDNPVLCSIPSENNRRTKGETSPVGTVCSSSSSISLRDTCGPSSVAFVISALEVWEMIP